METEKDILNRIKEGKVSLPPLTFTALDSDKRLPGSANDDLIVEANYSNNRYVFAAEVRRYGSDKLVKESATQARYRANILLMNPMVIVPWLSEEQLLFLEQIGVSGIDLCGNGIIQIPGELLVFRSGQENIYRSSRLVKRIYEGTSSLVARVFLSKPSYNSVSEILSEITARGGKITLSTISKALKQLEEDLVIEKSKEQIRLIQPEKLLDSLVRNYQKPATHEQLRCKISKDNEDTNRLITVAANNGNVKLVLSGTSSVTAYATMAREPINIYYCSALPRQELEALGARIEPLSRFPNSDFRITDSQLVFFDWRQDAQNNRISSPVQAYIELARSDKRGQETAEQIRKTVIAEINEQLELQAK